MVVLEPLNRRSRGRSSHACLNAWSGDLDCRRFRLTRNPNSFEGAGTTWIDEVTPGFKFNLRQRRCAFYPQLNPPWWLSHQSPAEVSWCSPPPVILSRTAHRTWTHTRHTDPNGTRNTHTEPHGTSTRDAHTMYSSLHIELSCVCGTVSCLLSPVAMVFACPLLLSTVVRSPMTILAHGISMLTYRLNAELLRCFS